MRKLLKFAGLALIAIIVGAFVWLFIAPPALIRVASAYSAKIVCSNVFIAGRDADETLRIDVQAPGHPILKYIRLSVDKEAGSVKASLLGLFGREQAIYREGFGCTSVNGALAPLVEAIPAVAPKASGLWPLGEEVAPSQDPKIAAILDDAALTGPGMRAIVVVQNGRIIGERYGEGFSAATPLLGWSMTKSVNAAIIGTLVRDGKLALDQKGFFPDWAKDGLKILKLVLLLLKLLKA